MRTTQIGWLRRGNTFVLDGEEYKINGLGNRDYDNVDCTNLKTKKRRWLDVDTDVEVEDGNDDCN